MKKFVLLFCALLLTACSNRPSDEVIQQQVVGQLNARYGSTIFEVTNFHKVNGIPRDDNRYTAEVEYDLRFLVDLEDATTALQKKSGSIFAAGMEAAALGMVYGNFRAGDTLHKQERVNFIRSEKGWLIDEERN